jgi:hypothetical protein
MSLHDPITSALEWYRSIFYTINNLDPVLLAEAIALVTAESDGQGGDE